MGRELKFRAWDKKNDYYADYEDIEEEITAQAVDGWRSEDGGTSFTLDCGIKHFELEQYTGLKDKNGKEIYEGDIVKTHYANALKAEHVEEIVFFGGSFCASNGKGFYSQLYNGAERLPSDRSVYMNEMEVIGNIHENPELLEKKI